MDTKDENFLLILSAMYARQFVMTKTLIEMIEEGSPITWNGFCLTFLDNWRREAVDTSAIMRRRLDKDHLKWMMDDLQDMGQEPPDTDKGDDD